MPLSFFYYVGNKAKRANKGRDRLIHSVIDWKLIDWLIDWLVNWLIDWLIDWFINSLIIGKSGPMMASFQCSMYGVSLQWEVASHD